MDVGGVAHHVDGVDEAVGDGGERALPVLGSVTLTYRVDVVAESGAPEVGGIGLDDVVGEEVAASELDEGLHTAVVQVRANLEAWNQTKQCLTGFTGSNGSLAVEEVP